MATGRADRRLAAILVADLVGYSARIGHDEAGTLAAWRAARQIVIEPALVRFRGRLFKSTGDGFVAEFASAVDAVDCADEIQRELVRAQTHLGSEERLTLRIGINVGDVVAEGDDLVGDGVNVAARLEQLCEPGGITISGSVHEQLSGRSGVPFTFAGQKALKNIARPVAVYLSSGAQASPMAMPAGVSRERPSVAVLPFDNMSGDPEQGYFSDGITEDIITDLSRFREIAVIARNASFAMRGKAGNLKDVGEQLGADFILEGSVRRVGPKVRINAQLIEAATGRHRWANRYDTSAEELFDAEGDIASSIVAAVATQVRADQIELTRRRPLDDLRAYDLTLQANRLSDDFRPEAQEQFEALLRQALTLDPGFARAHSGMAWVHINHWFNDVGGGESAHGPLALRAAEEAVRLDPADPRCHSTLGMMCIYLGEFERGAHHMDIARSLNPSDPTILILWAFAQGAVGNFDAALDVSNTAMRLQPQHPPWYDLYTTRLLFGARRYDEALSRAQRYKPFGMRRARFLIWQIASLGHMGRAEEAKPLLGESLGIVSQFWKGPSGPTDDDYLAWANVVSCLGRGSDRDHLRDGLVRAMVVPVGKTG